jgi:predicted lipoprotein with Yx(FWY)xxD motif
VGIAAIAAGGLWASVAALDATAASARTTATVVGTERSVTFGTILESGGHTLYTVKASKIACKATCLKYWPALVLARGQTKAKAGKGVKRSMLGTKKRAHGVLQVTYKGKPLYWFVGDTGHGQAGGNLKDAWGTWSVVVTKTPAGSPVGSSTTSTTSAPKSSTTATTAAPHGTPPAATTSPPTTAPKGPAPTTSPPTTAPPPTTQPPTTTTTPPTTTTTSGGGGPAF